MTYDDLLTAAAVLCGTPDKDDYEDYNTVVMILQLEELFKKNNFLRQYKGKEVLSAVPSAQDTTAVFAYEDELAPAFKYGLAAKLIMADRDMDEGLQNMYLSLYNENLASALPLVEESVVDVYVD